MSADLRLVAPAVSLWIAAAIVVGAPDAARPVALTAWLLAAGTLAVAVVLSRRKASGRLRWWLPSCCVSLVAVALVSSVIAVQAPGREPSMLTHAAAAGDHVTLIVRTESTGHAVSPGFDGSVRWRWHGTAEAIAGDAGSTESGAPDTSFVPVEVPVTVVAALPAHEARPPAFGSLVRVTGTLKPNAPGEATTFTLSAGTPVESAADPPWWLQWTEQVRGRFAVAASITPGHGGVLLPGLAIGDDTVVPAELDDAMKTSSLSHLTAVSGANCALVTAVVFFVAARAGLGRRARVVAALIALLAFVALVTPGGSVIRAATMAVVVLVGIARGRPSQGVPLLALAVMILLVHDPWLARNYGFALSVLATGGLIVLTGPLTRILSRWLPRWLALAVAVPFAAQLACQPVLVMLTPTIPLYGVAVNLLAAPAAPVATLLGCLACITLPFVPVLGQALVWVAWLPSAWIAQLALATSALPGSALPWADGLAGVLLCAGALVAVTVLVLGRHGGAGRGVLAGVAASSLVIGTVGYAGMLGGTLVGRVTAVPGNWQIAACDVGQGDALLIRDGGQVAMIDVGRRPDPAAACLARLGIDRVDLLVLTHYDQDHIGGLAGVAGRVRHAIVGEPGRDLDRRAVERLTSAGATVEQGMAGMEGAIGALRWRILWPPVPASGAPALSGNAGSVTLAVDGAGIRSIFLGDLGEHAQDDLLATGTVTPVDVVKVAHHGSADQSARLYTGLRASLGLVSVGVENTYGHPTAAALGMLAGTGTTIARTDTSGLLLVSPGHEPGRLDLWAERDAPRTPTHDPVTRSSADSASPPWTTGDSGRPYTGTDRGGTWRHEVAAGRRRAQDGRRAPSFRSSAGTRSGRRRSSSSRALSRFSPTDPSGCCATRSRRKIRASRSATSTPGTTRRGSCSPSRAPPCSASPG